MLNEEDLRIGVATANAGPVPPPKLASPSFQEASPPVSTPAPNVEQSTGVPPQQQSGGSNAFFKAVLVLAALSVITLVASFGYYLYTLQQTQTQPPPATSALPTPLPTSGALPQPLVQPTISTSDKTSVLDKEVTSTNLEDFEADFTALQQETEGL